MIPDSRAASSRLTRGRARQRFIARWTRGRVGLTDLTVAKIKRVCTERSYERGVGYYHHGHITSVRLAGSTVRATVEGTDEYNVELSWKGRRGGGGGGGEYYCDCPYSYEGECKHVVAVLLHVKDHSAAMIREAEKSSASIKSLLDGADEGHLREFLEAEMAGDAGLAERFARGTGTPYVAGLDYRDRIASMFQAEAAAEGRSGWDDDFGRVDLGGAMRAAAGFEESGDMAEASRIYGQIASAVSAHIDEVIGAEEHRGDARTAIAKWASCINKSSPTEADRRACISDAFFGYRRDANFSANYESAMWSLCRSDADYVHLLDLTAPHMPDPVPVVGGGASGGAAGAKPRRRRRDIIERESPERCRMLRIQVRALEKLGRRSDIDRLFEEHGRADPAVCAMRVKRLAAAGARAKAVRVASKGLDMFGHDESIAAAAAAVYGEREPGRLEILLGLFMHTLDWSYHDKLREMPGWPGKRGAVLKMLARDKKRPDRLIEMLVREGMHRKALREIVRCGDAALFDRYLEPVSGRYPRAYIVAYGRCVAGIADRAGSVWQYSRLARHLERMAAIAGGREVAAGLAAVISAKYPRKRLLLKALAPYIGRPLPAPRPRAKSGAKPRPRPRVTLSSE